LNKLEKNLLSNIVRKQREAEGSKKPDKAIQCRRGPGFERRTKRSISELQTGYRLDRNLRQSSEIQAGNKK